MSLLNMGTHNQGTFVLVTLGLNKWLSANCSILFIHCQLSQIYLKMSPKKLTSMCLSAPLLHCSKFHRLICDIFKSLFTTYTCLIFFNLFHFRESCDPMPCSYLGVSATMGTYVLAVTFLIYGNLSVNMNTVCL